MTTQTEIELSELRRRWLALEGVEAVEIHGWLLGVAVAIERKRNADPRDSDLLVSELRASVPPVNPDPKRTESDNQTMADYAEFCREVSRQTARVDGEDGGKV